MSQKTSGTEFGFEFTWKSRSFGRVENSIKYYFGKSFIFKSLFLKEIYLKMNFSTKDVEDELAELENSFDIFGSDAVLEVLEKAIGFECQNLDADEALYILNSVQNFSHFDHSPRMGCVWLFLYWIRRLKAEIINLMHQISTRYQGEKLSLLKTKANSNVSFAN